jgi:hypothetical protein
MDQGFESLITGLSNSLTGYLNLGTQYKMENAKEEKKNAQAMKLKEYESELDLKKLNAHDAYKLTLEGKIDAQTAADLHPEAATFVESFNKSNGRYPTAGEFDKLFTSTKKASSDKEANRETRIANQITQYSERLRNNKIIMGAKQANVSADQVEEMATAAKSGNTVAASAMAARMARAMGEVGVLTDSDLARYVQSGQIAQGLGDKLSKALTGASSDLTVDEIRQTAKIMKSSLN